MVHIAFSGITTLFKRYFNLLMIVKVQFNVVLLISSDDYDRN